MKVCTMSKASTGFFKCMCTFRDLFDKKKNEAENNFYLFQQKYKDTEFGIKIVDVLDIFRFSRSDVEDLINKMIIQRESNQDQLENS